MKVRAPFLGAAAVGAPAIAILLTVVPLASITDVEIVGGHPAVAGEILVRFRGTPNLAQLRGDVDAETDSLVGDGRVWHARSRSKNLQALITQLARRPDVLYAEPNYLLYSSNQPNDPRFPDLWNLLNVGQTVDGTPGTPGADIHATDAWGTAIGARTVLVGVVDTGVDYTHPDLAANVWAAPAPFTVSVGGRSITCPAGSHGFNALTSKCDPFDDHFHGTHVSGTIGAVGDNSVGVAGVNWLANIIGLKFLDSSGSGTIAGAIDAIEFGIQAKATLGAAANIRVLSNSWAGGGFSQALLDEITRANQNDMLFVAAAGNSASNNDLSPAYPANYAVPNVVAVAATDNQDGLASFSNYGPTTVHLGAPGVKVLSTVPGGAYNSFSGTSMATPHVSGSAALLLARCSLNTAALKTLILGSVDPIPSLAGRTITGGRLNLARAVAGCGPAGNAAPSITLAPAVDTTMSAPGPLTLAASAFDVDGSVARVSFYAGTSLIGNVTAPPYQMDWTNIPVGNYAVTAVAVDNNGATTTSDATTIRVLPGATSTPFGGTPATIPGTVEAENFNDGGPGVGYLDNTPGNRFGAYRATDVDIGSTTDIGNAYKVNFIEPGEWLAYSVSVSSTAQYTLESRVASSGTGGVYHVEVDGVDVTGPIAVPTTGGWDTWQTILTPGITMTAGPHMVRAVFDTKGATGWFADLNYMRWVIPSLNTPPTVSLTSPTNGATYVIPTIPLAATASDADGTVAQVSFYNGASLIGTDTLPPYTLSWTNVPIGTYTLTAVATDDLGATTTSDAVTVRVVPPPPSTPFGGTPSAIPGLLQAENFDDGGEGIAYHDTTPGNAGGQYRSTSVDIGSTADSGGGYVIGWTAATEWLKYTVSATVSANYTLQTRLASPSSGASFHVEIDGANVTGALQVPNTGGWETGQTMTVPGIPISAGPHVLRVVFDSNSSGGAYVGNFNYFVLTVPGVAIPPSVTLVTPAAGASYTAPATIALSANASDIDGTVTQVSFYNGSALIGTDVTAPFTFSWTNVPGGSYSLTAIATDDSGARTTSAPVNITVVTPPPSTPFGGTPSAIPGLLQAENFDDGGEGIAYHDTTSGNAGGQYRSTSVDIGSTADSGGGYVIGWTAATEWLKYTVSATVSANYTLQTRLASPGSGASFHVEIDGANVTGALQVPNTGGWETGQTMTVPGIPISAGPHVLRVVFDSNSSGGAYVGNFNYFVLTAP